MIAVRAVLALSALLLPVHAMAQQPDPNAILESYSGWWGMSGNATACSGPDWSSEKVAMGRYQNDAQGVRFGEGPLRLGNEEGVCELHEPELVDGSVVAIAVCATEGDEPVGRAHFTQAGDGLNVRSPIGDFAMERCTPSLSNTSGQVLELGLPPPQVNQPVSEHAINQPLVPLEGGSAPPTSATVSSDALTNALVGEWGVDGLCTADGTIRFSHDQLGNAANGTTDGLILTGHESRCRLSNPMPYGTGFNWSARCEVEGEVIDGGVSIALGQAETITIVGPTASGTLTDCSTVTPKPGPAEVTSPADASLATSDKADAEPLMEGTDGLKVVPLLAPHSLPTPLPDAQRGSIGAVYRDYCDPAFTPKGSESRLYEPYKNQLLVRYQANCGLFYTEQVLSVIALDFVETLELRGTTSMLDERGGNAVGVWLFLQHAPMVEQCGRDRVLSFFRRNHGDGIDRLAALASPDDLASIAAGYATGAAYWQHGMQRLGCEGGPIMTTEAIPLLLLQSKNLILEN